MKKTQGADKVLALPRPDYLPSDEGCYFSFIW